VAAGILVGAAVAVQLAYAGLHQVLACAGVHQVLACAGVRQVLRPADRLACAGVRQVSGSADRELGMVSGGAEAIGAVAPGVELTGAAETGTVVTGVAETGTVVIGVAATGTTGTAIGVTTTIIMTMISSSLVASDFHGGVGALAGAGAIRDTTVTVIPTAMATEVTHMAATVTDMETATGVGPESPSYSAGSLALVTITGPLMVSWDRRRVELFAPTSRTGSTPVSPVFRRQQTPGCRMELRLGLSSR
jgi:hypothetical protein